MQGCGCTIPYELCCGARRSPPAWYAYEPMPPSHPQGPVDANRLLADKVAELAERVRLLEERLGAGDEQ